MFKLKYSVILVLVLMTFLSIFYTEAFNKTPERTISLLQEIGDKCSDAADRSVANKIPIIEFQKLELISKKATILKLCMQDHGFYENPAWLVDAKPIAERNAKVQKISEDEALENLKRDAMLIFNNQSSHPLYWQTAIKNSLSRPI